MNLLNVTMSHVTKSHVTKYHFTFTQLLVVREFGSFRSSELSEVSDNSSLFSEAEQGFGVLSATPELLQT